MIRRNTLSRGLVLLTVAVAVFFLLLVSAVQAGGEVRPTETYVVRSGDTVWSLAGRLTPPGGDVRRTVFEIRHLNDLDTSIISPGQRLLVPAD